MEDYKESIYLCSRCGYCRDMVRARDGTEHLCPIREKTGGFDSYTARGRNWIARQILEGNLSVDDFSDEFIDQLFSCLFCGNCREHCLALDPETWDEFPNNKFEDHEVDTMAITRALRELVIEKKGPPPEIRDLMENLYQHGNPLGKPRDKRDSFTEELDFEVKDATEEPGEFLFYVGSVSSYDKRNKKTVVSLARVFHRAGVDFSILGTKEEDSGGEIRELGEEGLFKELGRRNIELFEENDIEKIVCLSPHDYNAFLNYYPEVFGDKWSDLNIEVFHYTKLLEDLLEDGRLEIDDNLEKKVTFHDPCFLGRWNGIFESPRKLIESTGSELIEMNLSRSNSYCCGGGGGGLWYEPEDKPKVENERFKQALETDADILAVACPNCTQMLEDGKTAVGGDMEITSIPELLDEVVKEKDQ